MGELERIVRVRPAYDCLVNPCGRNGCGDRPGASHGRHNAELHMTVRGKQAEVTLVVGTCWDLPETPVSMRLGSISQKVPHPMCVEFHSAMPQYEEHEPRGAGSCPLWTPCYVHAGYTMADEPTELLVREGSDAVWEWLERTYTEQFGALLTGGDPR